MKKMIFLLLVLFSNIYLHSMENPDTCNTSELVKLPIELAKEAIDIYDETEGSRVLKFDIMRKFLCSGLDKFEGKKESAFLAIYEAIINIYYHPDILVFELIRIYKSDSESALNVFEQFSDKSKEDICKYIIDRLEETIQFKKEKEEEEEIEETEQMENQKVDDIEDDILDKADAEDCFELLKFFLENSMSFYLNNSILEHLKLTIGNLQKIFFDLTPEERNNLPSHLAARNSIESRFSELVTIIENNHKDYINTFEKQYIHISNELRKKINDFLVHIDVLAYSKKRNNSTLIQKNAENFCQLLAETNMDDLQNIIRYLICNEKLNVEQIQGTKVLQYLACILFKNNHYLLELIDKPYLAKLCPLTEFCAKLYTCISQDGSRKLIDLFGYYEKLLLGDIIKPNEISCIKTERNSKILELLMFYYQDFGPTFIDAFICDFINYLEKSLTMSENKAKMIISDLKTALILLATIHDEEFENSFDRIAKILVKQIIYSLQTNDLDQAISELTVCYKQFGLTLIYKLMVDVVQSLEEQDLSCFLPVLSEVARKFREANNVMEKFPIEQHALIPTETISYFAAEKTSQAADMDVEELEDKFEDCAMTDKIEEFIADQENSKDKEKEKEKE